MRKTKRRRTSPLILAQIVTPVRLDCTLKPRPTFSSTSWHIVTSTFAMATRSIIGFGSLLSEASARVTFPNLKGFRLARVAGWRRVFRHAAAIFFERGIAKPATKEISSLSAERADEGCGFVVSVFDIEVEGGDAQAFWRDFERREEEFELVEAPFYDLETGKKELGTGWLCSASTDASYIERWGQVRVLVVGREAGREGGREGGREAGREGGREGVDEGGNGHRERSDLQPKLAGSL